MQISGKSQEISGKSQENLRQIAGNFRQISRKSLEILRQISGISQANFGQILAKSKANLSKLGQISSISKANISHISRKFQADLSYISGKSEENPRPMLGVFQAYLRHKSSMPQQAYFKHISGLSEVHLRLIFGSLVYLRYM